VSTRACHLTDLVIQDFVVVERLDAAFSPGLTVITGETGAGKSIIIDALSAALGARASTDWVRAGSQRASVEATFAFPESANLEDQLAEAGISLDEGSLYLRREILEGRSVARVNGRGVAGLVLEGIGGRLVDIHSQGDHVDLLRPRAQLDALDRFGRLEPLRLETAALARDLMAVRREQHDLQERARQAEREADLLRHAVAEIDAAAPRIGEEDDLHAQRSRLRHVLRLRELLAEVAGALLGDQGEGGAIDLAGRAQAAVSEIRGIDAEAALSEDELIVAIDALEAVQKRARAYGDALDDDPAALAAAEERLQVLAAMRRKYGPTTEAIIAFRDDAAAKLALLDEGSDRLGDLARRVRDLEERLGEAALSLSTERKRTAAELVAAVERELSELGMAGARFGVRFDVRADQEGLPTAQGAVAFDETGIDRIELQLAANPGEPPRPLSRVASGGELSRIMLALKVATAAVDPIPVLIFDELDQGVGGRMGQVVGQKLWLLSRTHQVLCITHLPQVASYADQHYLVGKLVEGPRAVTDLQALDPEERVSEIGAMLAGVDAPESARESAREMLERAAAWKLRAV
jgi:DNA repair protein RecN (Recombination protein N)